MKTLVHPEENGTGIAKDRTTKVEQMRWTMKDGPGQFNMLSKFLLKVDPEYQRLHVSQSRINEIARAWSWVAYVCVAVAKRRDGSYWVIDGQHRVLAARKRHDIQELPCMVFEVDTIEDEANGFISVNTVRGAMSAVEKFRALKISRDPQALLAAELLSDFGYHATRSATGPGQIGCIAMLLNFIRQSPDVCRSVFGLVVDLVEGGPINDRLFGALFMLELHLAKHRESIFRAHNLNAIRELGADRLIVETRRASEYFGKGGARIWAQGLINILNKRRRTRRLPDIAKGAA